MFRNLSRNTVFWAHSRNEERKAEATSLEHGVHSVRERAHRARARTFWRARAGSTRTHAGASAVAPRHPCRANVQNFAGSVGPPSPATSAAPIPHSLIRPRPRAHAPAPVSPRAIFALQGIFGGRMPCVGRRRLSGCKRDVHTASEKSTRTSEMHGDAHTRSRSRAHADALTNALAHAFQPTAHHSQSVSRTRAHACKHARMG